MSPRLKSLKQQVIVITGATSGIGLTTARAAADAGARLVLAARNAQALATIRSELQAHGTEVETVTADVGNEEQVFAIVDAAQRRFGGFDTWVNNAGIGIYGTSQQVSRDDMRRLFDTNFWGVVHGSLAALPVLKARGGTLITVGSITSDRAFPMQGIYGASKHAVKGFLDALRTELEAEGAPVSVTLVKPTSIDTPFIRHAKNYMDAEPNYPPPVYAPDVVADCILYAASHPVRDLYAGGSARLISAGAQLMPRVLDQLLAWTGIDQQKGERPVTRDRDGSLHAPRADLQQRAGTQHVWERSWYTKAVTNPASTMAIAAGAGLLLAATLGARRSTSAVRSRRS